MRNIALVGCGGFVAPRHLQAIQDTGNQLIAALDPSDSVGVLDKFFPQTMFFTETERFDRHLEKLRRRPFDERTHYIGICSPNYLHDAHCRLALRLNASAICEKPLCLSPWNIDQLAELEEESEGNVYTVLQLRLMPTLIALKRELEAQPNREKANIELTYVTRRGPWYDVSWKGDVSKSGGVATNVGIHFFDFLIWLFGSVEDSHVHLAEPRRMAGHLELAWARVKWFLSVDAADLPEESRKNGKFAYRSITMNGTEIDFSTGFADLHTRVYEDVMAGGGFRLEDARPAVEAVYDIRTKDVVSHKGEGHPYLHRG